MIFLTGGTGFLGQELLAELLTTRPTDEKFCVLVRPRAKATSEQRFNQLLKCIASKKGLEKEDLSSRISFVEGDMSLPRFGISENGYDQIVGSAKEIFHSGASVSFTQSLEQARAINVTGSHNIVELASSIKQRSGLNSLDGRALLNYVSTAYVAGDRDGIVNASELGTDHRFKNSYEQSKAEAEIWIRKNWDNIPTHIYRPSIILGDSQTGYSSSFTTIFVMLKVFMKGLFQTFPANPGVALDLVPVDYVAKSISKISLEKPGAEPCYHLCTGVDRETSLREILQALANSLHHQGYKKFQFPVMTRPEANLVRKVTFGLAVTGLEKMEQVFESFAGKRSSVVQRVLPYLLYVNKNPQFDMKPSLDSFPGLLKPAPLFSDYAELIFSYWIKNDDDLSRLKQQMA